MLDLGTFGGYESKAVAIDNQGRILIQSYNMQGHRAILWHNGQGTLLETFSGLADAAEPGLRVGVFRVDVSPPLGAPVAYAHTRLKNR